MNHVIVKATLTTPRQHSHASHWTTGHTAAIICLLFANKCYHVQASDHDEAKCHHSRSASKNLFHFPFLKETKAALRHLVSPPADRGRKSCYVRGVAYLRRQILRGLHPATATLECLTVAHDWESAPARTSWHRRTALWQSGPHRCRCWRSNSAATVGWVAAFFVVSAPGRWRTCSARALGVRDHSRSQL